MLYYLARKTWHFGPGKIQFLQFKIKSFNGCITDESNEMIWYGPGLKQENILVLLQMPLVCQKSKY